jgi:hypothetical protein
MENSNSCALVTNNANVRELFSIAIHEGMNASRSGLLQPISSLFGN